jgi:ABC-2 type transport system ATP-binding protein
VSNRSTGPSETGSGRPVIEINGLRKVYRSTVAVDSLTLAVPSGEVFGFLGPNGAGKTTAVKMLMGLIHPTAGEARLLGRPLGDEQAKARIGFLPELFQFHPWLRADEFLDFHGQLYGMPPALRHRRIGEVLELAGLSARRKDRLRTFSKGMLQRIGLAQAILNDPELVILDEPTSALDPLGRREVRDIIRQLKTAGKTVFLNSHLLSEVELVCDRVAIIDHGRVVDIGPLEDLLGSTHQVEMTVEGLNPALLEALRGLARRLEVEDRTVVAFIDDESIIPQLAETVMSHGGQLFGLVQKRRSLEELFVRLVEKGEEE